MKTYTNITPIFIKFLCKKQSKVNLNALNWITSHSEVKIFTFNKEKFVINSDKVPGYLKNTVDNFGKLYLSANHNGG